jgi:hypothetical protein
MLSASKVIGYGAALLLANPALARVSINPETRQFIDTDGTTLIFHGVNAVYKVDPYIPSQDTFDAQDSLTDRDI